MTAPDSNESLEALLGLSIEVAQTMRSAEMEAAMERHPSSQPPVDIVDTVRETLTAADRCDNDCSAAALYRLRLRSMVLDFCHHHHHKHFPTMEPWGWRVVGENSGLLAELYGGNRAQGESH